jgi:hypothetical protein
MDERINRFRYCDSRFYKYLDRVLQRMPESIREEIMGEENIQIVAQSDLPDICGRRYEFDPSVKTLIYLNLQVLTQPDPRICCSIAREIAEYVAHEKDGTDDKSRVVDLLEQWGFEWEVDAARFCEAVVRSEGFRAGYEWAKHQNSNYLQQHFGLYYDEWNEKGIVRMSPERLEGLRRRAIPDKILPNVQMSSKEPSNVRNDDAPVDISIDEAAMEGIMAAFKEQKIGKL